MALQYGMGQIEERLGAIARLIQTDQDAQALRLHVNELLGSPAFTNSRRSGQFLQYVVEKAVAQQTDALKERTIGIEVFHRPPDYDTGEDAIVRVTASDVRRRLAQHYSGDGRSSAFRISLPPGGYAPEVYRDLPAPRHDLPSERQPESDVSVAPLTVPPVQSVLAVTATELPYSKNAALWAVAACMALLLAAACLFALSRRADIRTTPQAPWSLLFAPGKPLLVVMADPDLNEIQALTGRYVTLADYAAGKLGCETLSPNLQPVCVHALRGDKSSTVDVGAISRVAALAGRYGTNVEPVETRSVRLPDLQTDRNVLLLGSRVADPWVDLFRDKLDFYVGHDQATGLQVVYNTHRRSGESDEYVPTAGPYGSGDNYTLISFLHNLNGNGYALLLTGATHEGMDAAVSLSMDPNEFNRARRDCGITTDDTPFQMLVKFKMMAGSPLKATSIICHRLAAQP